MKLTDEEIVKQEVDAYFKAHEGDIEIYISPLLCEHKDLLITLLNACVALMPNLLAKTVLPPLILYIKETLDKRCASK
jgi:hypothetical protein